MLVNLFAFLFPRVILVEKSAKLPEYLSKKASCIHVVHHNTSVRVKSHFILLV